MVRGDRHCVYRPHVQKTLQNTIVLGHVYAHFGQVWALKGPFWGPKRPSFGQKHRCLWYLLYILSILHCVLAKNAPFKGVQGPFFAKQTWGCLHFSDQNPQTWQWFWSFSCPILDLKRPNFVGQTRRILRSFHGTYVYFKTVLGVLEARLRFI